MDRDAYLSDPHVRDFVAWPAPLVSGRDDRSGIDWESRRLGFGELRVDSTMRTAGMTGRSAARLPGDSDPAPRAHVRRHRRGSRRARSQAPAAQPPTKKDANLLPRGGRRGSSSGGGSGEASAGCVRSATRRHARRSTATARLLDPATADLRRLADVSLMNSGFSKIYSLLLDGFPIYDSRVACGLASLVRLFCEESGALRGASLPLAFGVPPSQARARRDPSCGPLVFPRRSGHRDATRSRTSWPRGCWTPSRSSRRSPGWAQNASALTSPRCSWSVTRSIGRRSERPRRDVAAGRANLLPAPVPEFASRRRSRVAESPDLECQVGDAPIAESP